MTTTKNDLIYLVRVGIGSEKEGDLLRRTGADVHEILEYYRDAQAAYFDVSADISHKRVTRKIANVQRADRKYQARMAVRYPQH